jgi:hypothetical protein
MTVSLLVTFRIVALLVGAFIVFLGYSLFKIGYFESGGDFEARVGKNKLILKKAAPGVLFALFGAVVVAVGVWKPISVSAAAAPGPVIAAIGKILGSKDLSERERRVISDWISGWERNAQAKGPDAPDGRI